MDIILETKMNSSYNCTQVRDCGCNDCWCNDSVCGTDTRTCEFCGCDEIK